MIRLHDYELSGSCHKVRLLLGFLQIEYVKQSVDFVSKQHKSAEYLAINPFGELPILEDGDLKFRDAQAILVYVASRYDAKRLWYPVEAEAQGKIQQWLSTGGGEIMNASAARLVKGLNYPLDLDPLHAGAHRAFAILDAHLKEREFLELGRPTIADIACFPYAALAWEGGIDISGYHNIIAWISRVKRLPHFTGMPGM
jgi:glutathione S-transferase